MVLVIYSEILVWITVGIYAGKAGGLDWSVGNRNKKKVLLSEFRKQTYLDFVAVCLITL